MKCVPGDLAIVLRPTTPGGICSWTGLLVEVIEPLKDQQWYPDVGLVSHKYRAMPGEWLCRMVGGQKESITALDETDVFTAYGRMWDHRLRPIRDPGDDAADESKAWLPPVPTKEPA